MTCRFAAALFAFMMVACGATGGSVGEPVRQPVDFESLERQPSPNDYLVCFPKLCRSAILDKVSPSFPVPAPKLRMRIDSMLSDLPGLRIVFSDTTHFVIEERSAVFGFTDIIDIRVIGVEKSQSTLAIYSRSEIGYYDFGVNEQRVENWLRKLSDKLSK